MYSKMQVLEGMIPFPVYYFPKLQILSFRKKLKGLVKEDN